MEGKEAERAGRHHPDLNRGSNHLNGGSRSNKTSPKSGSSFEHELNVANAYNHDNDQERSGSWIGKQRSTSPMVDNIATKLESMLSPISNPTSKWVAGGSDLFARTNVSHLRQISALSEDASSFLFETEIETETEIDGDKIQKYVDDAAAAEEEYNVSGVVVDEKEEEQVHTNDESASTGGDADVDEHEHELNSPMSSHLKSNEIRSRTRTRTRTRSHNSHDNFDSRAFEVKGDSLVPIKQSGSSNRNNITREDSLSPPRQRNWRYNSCLPDLENVKRHTRRGIHHMRKKHQNRARKSNYQGRKTKSKTNRRRGGGSSNLAAGGDFSLRNKTHKMRRSDSGRLHSGSLSSPGKLLQEMDIVSDMSDNDPLDSRAIHEYYTTRPILPSSLTQHIPRAVEVVLSVGRQVSNSYGQVAQLMDSHTNSSQGADLNVANSESIDTEEGVEVDEDEDEDEDEDDSEIKDIGILSNSMFAVTSSKMDRGISDVSLERNCQDFTNDKEAIDQKYSDFIKKRKTILLEESSRNSEENVIEANEDDFDSFFLESVESNRTPVRSRNTRGGATRGSGFSVPSPPPFYHDLFNHRYDDGSPALTVRDRVQAYEVQNRLESSVAAGTQEPSTPRSRPKSGPSRATKAPPLISFQKFLPPKLNDTLKVLFMSAPHVEGAKTTLIHKLTSQRRKELSSMNTVDVNVYNWEPESRTAGDLHLEGFGAKTPTRFSMFDLKGGNIDRGSHASQFLFFSPNSLYIVVWDMAVNNDAVIPQSEDDDIYGGSSRVERRERLKAKEKAINRDIDNNVLYWLDVIDELNYPGSAIMPVVLQSNRINEVEMEDRCEMLKERMLNHNREAIIIFDPDDKVPTVSLERMDGVDSFRNNIMSFGSKTSLFEDHFKELPLWTVRTGEVISQFKSRCVNVVQFQELFSEISKRHGGDLSEELVRKALVFLSSIGEIVYFGNDIPDCSQPELLKDFVVLEPKWISDAIAPVLCKEDIDEVRRENFSPRIGRCFENLLVHDVETIRIWEDTDYIQENNKLAPNTEPEDLFNFLQQVCEHCSIFIPITIPSSIAESRSYLRPRVEAEPDCPPWISTSKDPAKTILCQSWLIREVLPITFMDHISAAVITDLINMFGDDESVEQVLCYKTAIYVKVVKFVPQHNANIITELYICLAHADSPNCINPSKMRNTDRKLMVCGKGFWADHGKHIWNLGFRSVLRIVGEVVREQTKGHFFTEVACPECVLCSTPQKCSIWSLDTVIRQPDWDYLRCDNAHKILPQLLRGDLTNENDTDADDMSVFSSNTGYTAWSSFSQSTVKTHMTYDTYDRPPNRAIPEILPAVVLVGIWDRKEEKIICTGSGFIADRTRGLIVTAGHIFYDITIGEEVGEKYFGIDGAIAIVGVYNDETGIAEFKYTADIQLHGMDRADCCILRLIHKFQDPITPNGCHVPRQEMKFGMNVTADKLVELKFAKKVDLETDVRVIGYNQEGEGLRPIDSNEGVEIDPAPCFAKGHVTKKIASITAISREVNGPIVYRPQSEVVIHTTARTKFGHSGGPCVNMNGDVVGILSRSAAGEDCKSFLAPASIIKSLLEKAKRDIRVKEKRNKVRFAPRRDGRKG